MYLGILLFVILGLIWAVTGLFISIAGRSKADAGKITLYRAIFVTVISCALMPWQEQFDFHSSQTWWNMLSLLSVGFFIYINNLLLCRSMGMGSNGISWAIFQSAMIVPFVLGICIHGDKVGIFRLVGFCILVIGIILIGIGGDFRKKTANATNNTRTLWLVLILLAFLGNGIAQYTQSIPSRAKEALPGFTSTNSFFLTYLGIIFAAAIHTLMGHNSFKHPSRQELLLGFGTAMTGFAGCFCLFPGLKMLSQVNMGAIAYPIAVGVCILSFTAYSAIWLKEKYSAMEITGMSMCLIGIVSLS